MGKKDAPYVFVATPAYDGKVHTGYSQSLAETAYVCPGWGIRFSATVMGNGAFIELNRNLMVQRFLAEKDYTHLFFIDSDLGFPFYGFVNMVLSDKPICAGVYRRRQDDEDYPANWHPHPEIRGPEGEETLWVEDDNWVMCNRVPTGFLCIRRDVVAKMVKDCQLVRTSGNPPVPWLFETKIDDEGRFTGEDFTFCDKYVKTFDDYIPVLADLEFDHDGYKGNYARFLSQKVESYKNKERKLGEKRA